VEIEEKEVLHVEKNLATQQHTTTTRSRFVVQGELGTSIERLSFTIWIYEKQKSKVPYRNQIASDPRLGKRSWIMMHYCAVSCSGAWTPPSTLV
jgi:hypothetical protein